MTKLEIYNLALNALRINKQIVNIEDSSTSKMVGPLNVNWQSALDFTLEDLNLDSTRIYKSLELLPENPNGLWKYAYKRPNDCKLFRRIVSKVRKDNRRTSIPAATGVVDNQKVIFTDQYAAIGEYVSNALNENVLSTQAANAVAFRLAAMSTSLNIGKNSLRIAQAIEQSYAIAKFNAQEHDRLENQTFDSDELTSEWVEDRIYGYR